MTALRLTQTEWTKNFSTFLNQADPGTASLTDLRHRWWFNPLSDRSLRLSKIGFEFVTKGMDLKWYLHVIENPMMPKTLIQLEKFIEYPYFIYNLRTLKIFDEATSVTLTLYNNDLQTYLNNVQRSI